MSTCRLRHISLVLLLLRRLETWRLLVRVTNATLPQLKKIKTGRFVAISTCLAIDGTRQRIPQNQIYNTCLRQLQPCNPYKQVGWHAQPLISQTGDWCRVARAALYPAIAGLPVILLLYTKTSKLQYVPPSPPEGWPSPWRSMPRRSSGRPVEE
jgi:hypothetical protein